jgi:hypothetical protein
MDHNEGTRRRKLEEAAAAKVPSKAARRDRSTSIFATQPAMGMPMPGHPMHAKLGHVALGTAIGTPVGSLPGAPMVGQPMVPPVLMGAPAYMPQPAHAIPMPVPPGLQPQPLDDRNGEQVGGPRPPTPRIPLRASPLTTQKTMDVPAYFHCLPHIPGLGL